MDEPVAVTVAVPVSGGGDHIEVTVTLSARRIPTEPAVLHDAHAVDDETASEPAEVPRPSAVMGGGRIQGVRQKPTG